MDNNFLFFFFFQGRDGEEDFVLQWNYPSQNKMSGSFVLFKNLYFLGQEYFIRYFCHWYCH